jgi:hypothetical protein
VGLSEHPLTAFLQIKDLLSTFSNAVYLFGYWFGAISVELHPETIPYSVPGNNSYTPTNTDNYITFLESISNEIPALPHNLMCPVAPIYTMHVTPRQLHAIKSYTNLVGNEVIILIKRCSIDSGLRNIANIKDAVDRNNLVQILSNLHSQLFARSGFTENMRIRQSLCIHPFTQPEQVINHIDSTIKTLHLYGDSTQDNNQDMLFYQNLSVNYPHLFQLLKTARTQHGLLHGRDFTWDELKFEFRDIVKNQQMASPLPVPPVDSYNYGRHVQHPRSTVGADLSSTSINSLAAVTSYPAPMQNQAWAPLQTVQNQLPISAIIPPKNRSSALPTLTWSTSPNPCGKQITPWTRHPCVNCGGRHMLATCPEICRLIHSSGPLTRPHWGCTCYEGTKSKC